MTWRRLLGITACVLFLAAWLYAMAYVIGAPS